MSREIWKAGTFVYPIPAVMVTSGTFENANIMTVAWTGIINTNPAMCYISVRPNEKLAYATDWCGVRSGSKYDKFKEMKLTKEKGKFVKCPLIKESPVAVECKVKEIKELGSHHMIIADVLSIDADKKYIDENGAFDISKCNLIAYSNGGYYSLGKKIGKFGFSVAKNKKKSKNNSFRG